MLHTLIQKTPLAALALCSTLLLSTSNADGLENGDFENGLNLWFVNETMSQAVPEAAKDGKLGLRVTDQDTSEGSSLFSRSFPVDDGTSLTLRFDARSDQKFLAVYLWPMNSNGKVVRDHNIHGDGLAKVVVNPTGTEWAPYSIEHTMPAGTESVKIWIHSWSSATGIADLDNLQLIGLSEDSAPIESIETIQTQNAKTLAELEKQAKQPALAEIPERAQPPVIILKLDDLRPVNGDVHHSWERVTNYLQSKEIACSIGIICEDLSEASPDFTKWVRQQSESGLVEFWFHGWDHGVWTDPDGQRRSEFSGRTQEEQLKRFQEGQELAHETLGIDFHTFGPGGGGKTGHQDEATAYAMTQSPKMQVWLYPRPIDPMGKAIAGGNITILDRIWKVNLEKRVGQIDYDRLVNGYAEYPNREYFVLQGHPTHWNDMRFNDFKKIIDFLLEQNARFMTPLDYARSLNGQPAQQAGK